MRDGTIFVVIEPGARYLAVCGDGLYKSDGDADDDGLRAVRRGVDPTQETTPDDELKWGELDTIAFGKGLGDIGAHTNDCSGTPLNVAATVRYKDGHTEQRALPDTTDLGIEGRTARGYLIAPIRDIAKLRMVADERWNWAKDSTVNDDVTGITLRITKRDGSSVTLANPQTEVSSPKLDRYGVGHQYGNDGLPALFGGAHLGIKWNRIAHVAIWGPADALRGDITYADGHREDVVVEDAELSGGGIGGENGAPHLSDIAKIDVTVRKSQH
ncbi:MAG TPA: hypothetical protein VJ476_07665 [Rhizomicrobium sp.]|nr:hypothetical protein [Rhizomicrobium sp.]